MRYNDQSIMRTLIGDSAHYKTLLVILMYPLAAISWSTGGTRVLFRTLNVFAFGIYILTTVQFVMFKFNGVIFLPGYFINGATPLMNGTLKMHLPWFANIMIFYNFYMFASYRYDDIPKPGKVKLIHQMLFLLGLFDCIVISRSRGVIFSVLLVLAIIIFMDKNSARGFVKKFILIVLLLVGSFVTGTITDFISSFSLNATRAYSTTARLYAIEYYWNYFVEHPLIGFGFADYISYYNIIHGDGRAAISDVGFFWPVIKIRIVYYSNLYFPAVEVALYIKKDME